MSFDDIDRWRRSDTQVPDLSIVIPTYCERQRIMPTVASLMVHVTELGLDWELVVSDDGSTDSTVADLRKAGLNRLVLLDPGCNRGKGAAVRHGMLASRGRMVMFTDADLSVPAREVGRLVAAIDDGADIAIGSRASGTIATERSAVRRALSSGLRKVLTVAAPVGVADSQCGFKLFRREAAVQLFSRQRSDGFAVDLEVLYLARRLGLRVDAVDVPWFEAPGSRVRPLRDAASVGSDIVRLRWHDLRGHYDLRLNPSPLELGHVA